MATNTPENNTPATAPQATSTKSLPRWRVPVKIVAWTLMGVTLFIIGFIAVALTILRPDKLTAVVNSVANRSLNADVKINRVELSMASTFPVLNLKVDGVTVTSRDTKALDADMREGLPEWADTLLTVNSIRGGLDITSLARNRLDLSDVIIDAPKTNLVVVDDSVSNFNIFYPSEDTTAINIAELPLISINRFEITNPGPIRYYDHQTGSILMAGFKSIGLDGSRSPLYVLDFTGNIEAPLLTEYFHFEDLSFGLQGNIRWNQKQPYRICLDNFRFGLTMFKGTVSTDIDFTNTLVLNTLNLNLDPIGIKEVINVFPEEMAEEFELPVDLETSAQTKLALSLKEPFNVSSEALPHLEASVEIPDTYLRWQQLDLRSFKASLDIDIPSDDLDLATVTVNYLDMTGPATDIHIKGTFTNLLSDPVFNTDVNTDTDLSKLPPVLKKLFDGTVNGNITAHAHLQGRTSMFSSSGFQNLIVNGDIGLRDFYWLSSDTVNMIYVDRALFNFDSQKRVTSRQGAHSGPLLSGSLKFDSLSVLSGNYVVSVNGGSLGLATRNSTRTDTTAVHPMGGGLKIERLKFLSISDSITVRARDIGGLTIIRPRDGDMHRPEFIFKLGLGRLALGNNEARFMISKAHCDFSAYKNPLSERQKRIRRTTDSLMRVHPDLPPDSVMAYARRIHRRNTGRHPRVHTQMATDSAEIIDWGMSRGMRRLLTQWTLSGTLTSERARLFTPYFPLRNKLDNLNISFNNDTIRMNNVVYRAGRSDLMVSGEITNMRRALTSRSFKSPLRARFETRSDTIDVNQLANAAFSGSAYYASSMRNLGLNNFDNENALDSIINLQAADATGNISPILVPKNVDLQLNMRARNLLYSDLLLKNMSGALNLYDGALNLHNLSARSDVGNMRLSALYLGRDADSLSFGFGLKIHDFNLHKFLDLVPAVDSMMPVLRDFSGIISADIAATSPINRLMELNLARLDAAISLEGDSLVLIDPDTFKSLSKWLFFKDKKRNIIDHMAVQMAVRNGTLQIYPFVFDIDRYKLGVQGYNDFAMNFDYHIAVFKSPIPFKFGINIKGSPDKFKIRLGGAKLKENTPANVAFVDTTRVNLLRQIENIFRRGVRGADMASLRIDSDPRDSRLNTEVDTLSAADSLQFYRQGLIDELPAGYTEPDSLNSKSSGKKNSRSGKKHKPRALNTSVHSAGTLHDLSGLRPRRSYKSLS